MLGKVTGQSERQDLSVLPANAGSPVRVASSSRGHLVASSLTKRYGNVPAIYGVSIDVAPGEFFTLLGPSGSGKSSTILAIAGFVTPDEGSITLDGFRLDEMPVERRNLGVVFQNYALFPHMTVRENLAFPLEVRGLHRRNVGDKIRASLALVGLEGREGAYPSQLSGGQQQRVAMARALIFEPAVLLMDEPLGALDKNLRARLQLELRELQRRLGITTIYVTHDQEEAFTMSDRIAVMNHGKVEQVDSPAVLYDAPASVFVADFVGENNFYEGRVVEQFPDCTLLDVPSLGRVRCRKSELASGSPVTVAVRPEHLSSVASAEPGEQEFYGRVEEAIFIGATTKYFLRLRSGQRCLLRESNSARSKKYTVGESVRVSFLARDVRAFPRGEAASDE